MKKIALMGSGILSKIFAERAKFLGIESHCFSFNREDIACAYVDYFHEIDIFDIDTITDICKKNGIDGVIATTELTILPAAQIAKNIGVLGNREDVARDITNKYLTRDRLSDIDELNQPKYWLTDGTEIPTIDEFPVIVKPIAAGGKRGVAVINSHEELKVAIDEALSFSKKKGVIIEEYLNEGTEYSVESISYKGRHYFIQVTKKDSSGPPRCNELGHHQPAEIDDKLRKKIEKVLGESYTELGIENGPCHTEIKIINRRIYLIEINGRPGGDHITYPLTELSTDYPFVSAIIWAAIGCFEGHEPKILNNIPAGIFYVTKETAHLQNVFENCEEYKWFYHKNKVNEGPSTITFNDEDGLNYFMYYGEKPMI